VLARVREKETNLNLYTDGVLVIIPTPNRDNLHMRFFVFGLKQIFKFRNQLALKKQRDVHIIT
jgi:hypothetical protein